MPEIHTDGQELDEFERHQVQALREAEEYFVLRHSLQGPITRSTSRVRYRGVIHCHGGIEIHVDHRIDRDHANQGRTARISYHAEMSAPTVVTLMRHDNAPHYAAHTDAFHKHLFDDTGKQTGVEHVGRDAFPTLRNVIDEVFEW